MRGEGILILLVGAFLLLPLPLCIYLLVQVSRLKNRLRGSTGEEKKYPEMDTLEKAAEATALKRRVSILETQVKKLQEERLATASVAKAAVVEAAKVEEKVAPPVEVKAEAVERADVMEAAKELESTAKEEPKPEAITQEEKLRNAFEAARQKAAQAKQEDKQEAEGPSLAEKIAQAMRTMGLLPPKDRARDEVDLMQWWAPRIGGMLAVLAVIFFAVYVANSAPPWVRFLELLAGDAVVIALGFKLLKKRRNLGQVVLATGLSMLYISSVAAYVARPIRIIDDPVLGLTFQLAVLVLNIAIGLRLGFRNVVLLSLIYGYASALFSAMQGLREGALLTALALQIAGALLHKRLRWLPLIGVGTLGYTLPVFGFYVYYAVGGQITLPWTEAVLIYLGIGVSLLPLKDRFGMVAEEGKNRVWRLLMGINTSACLATGYLYVKAFNQSMLEIYYGGAASLFLVWAALYWIRDNRGYAFHLWFLKGTALAALFVVAYFEGPVRWFALAVETVLLAWSARRSRSPWLEGAVYACAIAAFCYWDLRMGGTRLALSELLWWMHASFPLLMLVAAGILYGGRDLDTQRRVLLTAVGCVMTAVFAMVAYEADVLRSERPLIVIGGVVATLALTFVPRWDAWAGRVTASLLFVVAHIVYWVTPSSPLALVGLLALSAGAVWIVWQRQERAAAERVGRWQLAEAGIHALWSLSLLSHLPEYPLAPWHATIGVGLGIVFLLAARGVLRGLADVAFWPVLVALVLLSDGLSGEHALLAGTATFAIVLGCTLFTALFPISEQSYNLLSPKRLWSWVWSFLLLAWLVRYHDILDNWILEQGTLGALAVIFFFSWKRFGIHAWAATGLLVVLWQFIHFVQVTPSGSSWDYPTGQELLLVGLAQVVIVIWLSERCRKAVGDRMKTVVGLIGPVLGYFLALKIIHYPLLDMARHRTVLIALYCLALLVMGFVTLNKQTRLVAIYGFLLPLFWLFVYDIQDTLVRIIAFGALAALLIGIGYLYNRYKDRLKG